MHCYASNALLRLLKILFKGQNMDKKEQALELLGFRKRKGYYTHKSFGEQQFDFSEIKLEYLVAYIHSLGYVSGEIRFRDKIRNLLQIR